MTPGFKPFTEEERSGRKEVEEEVEENAVASEDKSCRQGTIPVKKSLCVSRPLSLKKAVKITFAQFKLRTLQSIIYSPEEKFLGTSSIWYEVIVVCCLPTPFLHSEAISPARNTRARNLRKIPTHIHFTSLTAEI